MSLFDNIKSFSKVDIREGDSNAIEVVSFVESCDGLATVFDSLGTAFSLIKSDVTGNIAKIRAKHAENPTQFTTLQQIVSSELTQKKRTSSEGLLWLKRTLDLTHQALARNQADPAEELGTSFAKAYDVALAPFHSFLVKPVFSMAMKACPTRADFYAKLGVNNDASQAQLDDWLKGLGKCVQILNEYYQKEGIDKDIYARK
ncbi:hypothetical protein HDU98_003341 [Podochytrium sp. JEL0797]|nr:hypothetical protein HDU98_003341 [Podochytrium sp. JEL0797]